MSKRRSAYPPEFRRQMVQLVWSGRNPEELLREFEPTAQAIRNWVAHAGGPRARSRPRRRYRKSLPSPLVSAHTPKRRHRLYVETLLLSLAATPPSWALRCPLTGPSIKVFHNRFCEYFTSFP